MLKVEQEQLTIMDRASFAKEQVLDMKS